VKLPRSLPSQTYKIDKSNNINNEIAFIEKYNILDILAPNRTPETRDIEILEGFSKMIKIESEPDLIQVTG
jgi:hypothetical protein